MTLNLKDTLIPNLLKLTGPIIAGQLGMMLIAAGDVYIATLFSTKAVASIGVANGFINPIFLFGIGLMMGVSPILAKRRGEGKKDEEDLISIILYSLLIGLVLTFITLVSMPLMYHLGIEPELLPSMEAYIEIVAWSLPFAIVFTGVREYLQSYEKVLIPNLISVTAVVFNLIVNLIKNFFTSLIEFFILQ